MKDEIKEILDKLNSGVWEKDEEEISYKILFSNEVYQLLDYIKKLKNKLEDEKKNYKRITTYLQEENERLKMTNLALADDITKNKIIKQEVLTECCGIPIGEIPMLKIQNDEYKQRIDKAIEYIKEHSTNTYFSMLQADYDMNLDILLNILQGKSDE